jgi:hypothetical protein
MLVSSSAGAVSFDDWLVTGVPSLSVRLNEIRFFGVVVMRGEHGGGRFFNADLRTTAEPITDMEWKQDKQG